MSAESGYAAGSEGRATEIRSSRDLKESTKVPSLLFGAMAMDAKPGPVDMLANRERPSHDLLSLPPDIRNIIYCLVFHQPHGVQVDLAGHDPDAKFRPVLALALTCKQIYDETRSLPYWLNDFHLHVPVLQNMESIFTTTLPLETWPVPEGFPSDSPAGSTKSLRLPQKDVSLEQKSRQFVSKAVRLPHATYLAHRLAKVMDRPHLLSQLRKVHIHLGSQVNNTFVERFFHAWSEVDGTLRRMSAQVELRLSFQLRISRGLVVQYDFDVTSAEKTLADMNACVKMDRVLTLPEISTINAVRTRVWRTFIETASGGSKPAPFRAAPRTEATTTDKKCGERTEELLHIVALGGVAH